MKHNNKFKIFHTNHSSILFLSLSTKILIESRFRAEIAVSEHNDFLRISFNCFTQECTELPCNVVVVVLLLCSHH